MCNDLLPYGHISLKVLNIEFDFMYLLQNTGTKHQKQNSEAMTRLICTL